MKTVPYDNGILICAETDFEVEYLRTMFTLNQDRKVIFNPESSTLKVIFVNQVTTIKKE